MVAGREACSCAQCGTVCKGKFAGCVDVWARGPRAASVRIRPEAGPLRRVRSSANGVKDAGGPNGPNGPNGRAARAGKGKKVERGETVPIEALTSAGPGLAVLDTKTMAAVDTLVDKVRQLEATVATVATAPRPGPSKAVPFDDGQVEAVVKAVGGIAAGLDRLTTDVKQFQAVPGRVEALERRATSPSPAGAKVMERLAGDIARLSVRIDDLAAADVKSKKDNLALQEVLKGLAPRIDELDKARARDNSARPPGPSGADIAVVMREVEQRVGQQVQQRFDKLTSRMAPLEELAARVERLEKAEPPPSAPDLTVRVEKLAAQLAALESRPAARPEPPGQQHRIASMEKVLAGLVQGIERLSGRVAGMDEVPKRIDALEWAQRSTAEGLKAERARADRERRAEGTKAEAQPSDGPPLDKVLASIGKRLDRLSTQVGELKGLPERIQAIEDDPGRTETLSRGLAGAIDMIDQLSAQLAAIEHRTTS